MDGLNYYAIAMSIIFLIGYAFITIEHITQINKATIALMMAILCWILQFADNSQSHSGNMGYLGEHLANISQVIFFLLGALAVVEIINVHKGFNLISDAVKTRSKVKMLWVLGMISFFLSAVLDNLTTTIVMVSLSQKLIEEREDRLIIGGGIVIAANAGGAWTPIGDVTTTMLWIGGQITTIQVMKDLFLPSLACVLVSLFALSFLLKGEFKRNEVPESEKKMEPLGGFIFVLGIGLLMFVPIFKLLTGLPPFMGILFSLSVLWIVTDLAHFGVRDYLRVPQVLTKVDLSGILFFLGILLCIDALDTAGILKKVAFWLDANVGNTTIIATIIGIASAIVDNVPLVAASMGMYDLAQYPVDSKFWQLVAYCAGTGGSMLIIGSAAGVVYMGLEKVDFIWYLKKISVPALLGYFAGIGVYLLFH